MEATRPEAPTRSTSPAVRASSNVSGYRRTIAWRASICSSVAVTAVSPGRFDGTYTDQNWPPRPPSRMRGMSVMMPGTPAARSSRSKS